MLKRYKCFAIIGAGVVGTSMAVFLEKAGLDCIGVNTRSLASYERFCRYLPKQHLGLEEIAEGADLIFITTHDGAIENVAQKLADCKKKKPGQIWIHCSGSLQAEVMRKNNSLEVGYLSIHPLQAFATIDNALMTMIGTHYGVEGNNRENEEAGEFLVKVLQGIPHRIEPSMKTLYHAGAVMASNYLVSLSSLAVKLFGLAGINQKEALQSLLPLMEGSYHNIERVGLAEALTGPIARGDVEVVAKHLNEIPAEYLETYKGLGRLALELAQEKGYKLGTGYDKDVLKELEQRLT